MKQLKTLIAAFAAFAVFFMLSAQSANAASYLVPSFQRSWGALDRWYALRVPGTNDPLRETYHARNPWADPDSVKDGWWKDANFTDWMPLGWSNDPRFFNNRRDYGFSQAERFLFREDSSGAIKFLADASGKPVQKRMKTEVTVIDPGTYRFESYAWFSQYNGDLRNVHLAMEIAVNGIHIDEPNVKIPVKNTWQLLKSKDVVLKAGDKVKITLIADQKNESNDGLMDAYFTLPANGLGIKL